MVEFREAPVDNGRVSPHKHRITDYLRPKTLAMLLLGFSSGLPFLLVGNTFGFWLRDEHTSLTAIGFLSWVGIAYSLKFLWAPVMAVSYTHLRAHETPEHLVCRLLLEKK